MTDNTARRRGHGEDAIYFDAAKNRYVGAISVGFGSDGKRVRRKVSGRTKAEVRDKLKAAHNELDRGLHTSATYTVRQAVDDWLEGGLPGRSERTRSIYREALKPLLEHIGLRPLRELTARDVRRGLEALSGKVTTWSAGTWRLWSTTPRARSGGRAGRLPWRSPPRCSRRPGSPG